MNDLALRHPAGVTRILVGEGAARSGGERLSDWLEGRTVFVLSSDPVRAAQGGWIELLTRGAKRVVELTAPDGEAAKDLGVAAELWERMLELGGGRDSRLIAFGGGTVGDLGGFLAGCFLRGIEFVQVPTTLLAQADAAIGGKTGVDLPGGKNTVGLFHHPFAVVVDPGLLTTLPRREWRCGAVEILKIALATDAALFEQVENDWTGLLEGDLSAAERLLPGAIAAKVRVVEEDPCESDRRRALNLGHTLGHALEAAAGYQELRHGEAVAYGLLFVLDLAERRGMPADAARRVRGLLQRLDLPALPRMAPAGLIELMGRDKKASRTGLEWVVPTHIGSVDTAVTIPRDKLADEVAAFLQGSRGRAF